MVTKKYTKTELNKLKRVDLLALCKKRKIVGCSTKKVAQLRTIIYDHQLKSSTSKRKSSQVIKKPRNFTKMKVATLKGLVTRFKLKPRSTRKSDLVLALTDYYAKKSKAKSIKIPTRRKSPSRKRRKSPLRKRSPSRKRRKSPKRKRSPSRKRSVGKSRRKSPPRKRSPSRKRPVKKPKRKRKSPSKGKLRNAKTGRIIQDTPANRKNREVFNVGTTPIIGSKTEINSLKKILKGESPTTEIAPEVIEAVVSAPLVSTSPESTAKRSSNLDRKIEDLDVVQGKEMVSLPKVTRYQEKFEISPKPSAAVSAARENLMLDFERCLSTL